MWNDGRRTRLRSRCRAPKPEGASLDVSSARDLEPDRRRFVGVTPPIREPLDQPEPERLRATSRIGPKPDTVIDHLDADPVGNRSDTHQHLVGRRQAAVYHAVRHELGEREECPPADLLRCDVGLGQPAARSLGRFPREREGRLALKPALVCCSGSHVKIAPHLSPGLFPTMVGGNVAYRSTGSNPGRLSTRSSRMPLAAGYDATSGCASNAASAES